MIALRFRRPGLHALALALVLGAAAVPAAAQPDSVTVRVAVSDRGRPVTRARVQLGQQATRVDRTGTASFRAPAGRTSVGVTAAGYVPWRSDLFLDRDTLIAIPLREVVIIIEDPIGLEEIVVTATRSEQRIEDAPVRVEVLAREEVEEKMLMTPGDVAMMLNETSGLRVQTTSPSLGGANVRVQGLRGRYTQVLSDGLPLYGGQSGSLGLLQIPPMDLRQVEVIKGAASALYGSSALGGVVNLVSRLPEGDRELLLNATTLGGADAVLWSSAGSRELGYTLLAGLHRQWDADVDGDGWADVPAYRRAVIRPRLFWADDAGRSAFATLGATLEEREGGGRAADGTVFPEELGTRRVDAGLAARWLVERGPLLNARASGMMQRHAHAFGPRRERDRHATWFGETSAAWTVLRHTVVLGAAVQQESYRARDVEGFDYTFTIPSVFAQDDWAPAEWLAVTASARADWHSEYGAFVSPRVSALLRPAEGWSVRASAGGGYFAPTPFTEETEAIGLAPLHPLGELEAERAVGASLDVGRVMGDFELNASVFASEVENALQLVALDDEVPSVVLSNALGPVRTWGTEALVRWHSGPWHATATHTWTRAREPEPGFGTRREVPLTPRHQAGIVAMWEAEGEGRIGAELYYTGRQALDDNPYRTESRPYVVVGFLAERRIGRARVFVNAENLADARVTRWHPLPLPARSPELRWTTDAWAPLEGRAINAGVRLDW